jgi:hypothetical protein
VRFTLPNCLPLALLFAVGPLSAAEPRPISGKVSAETFVYTDDNHVDVFTPALTGTVENILAGWSVTGHYLVDVVTAASPDIIASASPPFREMRHDAALGGTYRFYSDLEVAADASISVEPDYLSISGGARLAIDMAQKNFTPFLGYAYRNDTIGRAGTTFDVFHRKFQTHSLTTGMTVVLNRSTLLTVQVDGILERGDQSKPYRYVPLFEVGTKNQLLPGSTVDQVNAIRLDARPLEQLPLERDRYALTARIARRFGQATLRAEERIYMDSWGLKATTTDIRFMKDVGRYLTLWPHARLHAQTGTNFWSRVYEVERPQIGMVNIPPIRTGDRELGPLVMLGIGGGASIQFSSRFAARMQIDGQWTSYLDALYVARRLGLFTALSVEASFD